VSFGFRFFLIHPDGERADPAVFVTTMSSWRPGDEFLAGSTLRKFRILDVDSEQQPDGADGVLTVELVDS